MSGLKWIPLLGAALVVIPAAAPAATSPLIINEVDCNEPGTADNGQFIELMNIGDKTVDLGEYTIEIVDGANPPGTVPFSMTFESTKPQIEPGAYFVMCRSEDISTLSSEVCNRFAPYSGIKYQCDRRDGIRLLKGTEVVDSLSWGEYLEGTTEGTNPAPEDWDTEESYSISRVPDGLDTDQNDFDFKWTCASPHRANYTANECLCLRTACTGGKVCNPETGVCEVVVVPEDVIEDTGAPDNGGPDESTADTGAPDSATGEDADQPGDTLAADPGKPDTGALDVARHDSGPGFDAAQWVDLPGVVDEDANGQGEDDDGCTATRRPGDIAAFAILLLIGTAVIVRRRVSSPK